MLKEHPNWALKPVAKDKLIKDAKQIYGDDLVGAVSSHITEEQEQSTEVAFVGNGLFLDKDDLEDKDKNKQKRLAAILKNTETYWDPVSECLLYEDMTYVSSNKDQASSKRKASTEIEDINRKISTGMNYTHC